MAANMFVKISDIPGDATEKEHDKWIVIQSCSWNVERAVEMTDLGSTQRGHANSNFGKVEVTSQMGLASNKLMTSVANGTIRPEITINFCRSGESASAGLEAYSIWTLKHVVIDSYAVSGSEDGIPEETWTMAYTAIEHEYKSTDQKSGKLKTENTFKWNVQTGKVE
ncbi:Hcp family type VI secretion system effector [Antarcticimicrobium luteum]|uniref:Type VI secretion system tube protein Hcp n=1 Tax=Antarcticimicrobium luteum TaxID=2547397 RepID=A0A4R5VHH6_9RHOB|nr:type VI secretion system tube protein Hcp [Antarcticimicrobium luteum]TDK53023.1 type VI secretion system tube protein Hcp [Antarcticimicrobium luteum]